MFSFRPFLSNQGHRNSPLVEIIEEVNWYSLRLYNNRTKLTSIFRSLDDISRYDTHDTYLSNNLATLVDHELRIECLE